MTSSVVTIPVDTSQDSDVQEGWDGSIELDTSHDAEILSDNKECWDDLSALRDDLAESLLKFVMDVEQTEAVVSSPEGIARLGANKLELDKSLNVFYSDVARFADKIQELRLQHEHLSGGIQSVDDLNLFTRLSMGYRTLQIELHSLLSPTIASIMLILHEAFPFTIQEDILAPGHTASIFHTDKAASFDTTQGNSHVQ